MGKESTVTRRHNDWVYRRRQHDRGSYKGQKSIKAPEHQSGIIVSEPREERRKYLEQAYGVKTTISNKEVASSCNIIISSVKPQIMGLVLEDINSVVTDDKTVVSIAAGITLSYLQSKLNTKN